MLEARKEKDDSLETESRARAHVAAGRGSFVRSSNNICANPDNIQFEHSRPSHTWNPWSESVFRQRAGKAHSGSFAAFPGRRHRPQVKTESRTAAFECRQSFGSLPALGTINHTAAPHKCLALY